MSCAKSAVCDWLVSVLHIHLQDIESKSDVKAGDKLPLLNAKPGSSSLEVTVSLFVICPGSLHCSYVQLCTSGTAIK